MRWRIEATYKAIKSRYLDQPQLHAKNRPGVVQEVLALILFVAISNLAAYVTRIVRCSDQEMANRWLAALLLRVARAREQRRRGRSFPRRSFKPSPRWGSAGRRGGSWHCRQLGVLASDWRATAGIGNAGSRPTIREYLLGRIPGALRPCDAEAPDVRDGGARDLGARKAGASERRGSQGACRWGLGLAPKPKAIVILSARVSVMRTRWCTHRI